MKPTKALFITFDLSGYYNCIFEELKSHYDVVDYYNLADYKNQPYKNIGQRISSFYLKKTKNLKLKNYYKYNPVIEDIKDKSYDFTLIIRPDLFFDKQLKILRKNSKKLIAYYHDSINNIPRKKDVIHFFDEVYSYEKRDVKDFNLKFIPNFIYLNNYKVNDATKTQVFTVISKDYRFKSLIKLATFLKQNKFEYKFLVHSDKEQPKSDLIQFITERKTNSKVLKEINQASIIADIHKYGIQDGLTFRVFESLYFKRKLITSNTDIKNYEFYNPNNIHVIENFDNINIPRNFFLEPYQDIPEEIYKKHLYTTWVKTILGRA